MLHSMILRICIQLLVFKLLLRTAKGKDPNRSLIRPLLSFLFVGIYYQCHVQPIRAHAKEERQTTSPRASALLFTRGNVHMNSTVRYCSSWVQGGSSIRD
uniref:Secreted protein n=1 Tax=Setaria viridis TaxID=4556 RepID=A0A4U6WJ37_SETVI|nr:hypothetical protein SEVIR_1G092100v2 [Setaria viridis]